MTLLSFIVRALVVVGAGWILSAALVGIIRTRQLWPAGRILPVAAALLLLASVPQPPTWILAAEGVAWVLSGLFSDTLAWVRTPAYATPRDLLLFRRPLAPASAPTAEVMLERAPAAVALRHP